MIELRNRTLAAGVLLVAFGAAPAGAQPASAASKATEKGGPGANKLEAKAAKAEQKTENKPGKPEAKVPGKGGSSEHRAERAGDAGREAQLANEDPAAGAHGKAGQEHGRFHGGLGSLHEEFKSGKLKKSELKQRLDELRDSNGERRKEHKRALKQHWGPALAQPSAVEELRHHARRMAFLNRALLLVETDDKVKDKKKFSERIEKLIEKENARHERSMERLKTMPSSPGAASAAPGASAAIEPKRGEP